jgi:hypothetical protein
MRITDPPLYYPSTGRFESEQVRCAYSVQSEPFGILAVHLFKIIKPAVPARSELSKTTVLELRIISGSLKAKSLMKIDMVNPIPLKKPAPTICFQDTSLGN